MPIGPFPDFAACEAHMQERYGVEGAKRVCGAMEAHMQSKSEQGHTFHDLPTDAQTLWIESFVESLEKNDDVGSAKIAWANVYRRWEKSPSGQWNPFKVLSDIEFKSLIKQDRIIYGAASVAIVDSENELITESALKAAFNSYITRGHVLFYHRNVPVGEVLPSYQTTDGRTLKSGVSDGKLDIVVRLYKDTQIANEVWDAIEKGELRAFSIGGQVIGEPVKVCQNDDCSQSYERIDQIDLHEISIVPNPANDASYFNVIKSKVESVTERKPEKLELRIDSPEAFAVRSRTLSHAKAFGLAKNDDEAVEQVRDWLKHPFSKYHISKLMALEKLITDDKTKVLNCPTFTEKAMKIISGEEDAMPDAFAGVLSSRMDKLTDGMEKLLEMVKENVSESKRMEKLTEGIENSKRIDKLAEGVEKRIDKLNEGMETRIDKLTEGMEKLFEMFTIKVVTK